MDCLLAARLTCGGCPARAKSEKSPSETKVVRMISNYMSPAATGDPRTTHLPATFKFDNEAVPTLSRVVMWGGGRHPRIRVVESLRCKPGRAEHPNLLERNLLFCHDPCRYHAKGQNIVTINHV